MSISAIHGRPDVASLLARMREMRAAAAGVAADHAGVALPTAPQASAPDAVRAFTEHLAQAIDAVDRTQQAAGAIADSFVRGEHGDLVGVMVASQKANVAFTAATQVRNRLVEAYENIMNMPI